MKGFQKLERKYGKYAIHNLMYYIIGIYIAGFLLYYINPNVYATYFALDASKLLKGQIWRIVTFLLYPQTDLLYLILNCYINFLLGTQLERTWGAFRFNVYFFMGILFHVLGAIVIYLAFGKIVYMSVDYLNWSLFFAFAVMYPHTSFLLFFLIPIKAKTLAILNGIYFGVTFVMAVLNQDWATATEIFVSMLNFLVFFVIVYDFHKYAPKELHRKRKFKQAIKQTRNVHKHRCAVCGRTEDDDENLVFRYCSKCDGNYEYCQDHLYTHVHIKKDTNTGSKS